MHHKKKKKEKEKVDCLCAYVKQFPLSALSFMAGKVRHERYGRSDEGEKGVAIYIQFYSIWGARG